MRYKVLSFAVLLALAAPAAWSQTSDSSDKISHVVIIVQENRTVDNLFQKLPGAATQSWGLNLSGKKVTLQQEPLNAPYVTEHLHQNFMAEWDTGKMDGFNKEQWKCNGSASQCPTDGTEAYAYVPAYDVKPYYDLAEQYGFGDEMFETNEGPSFPAHQYLVSGTSSLTNGSDTVAAENPTEHGGHGTGGCDSQATSTALTIKLSDPSGIEGNPVFPCFGRLSLVQELDAAGLSWHYYQHRSGPALWNALDAIKPIWKNQVEYNANVITPETTVLTDIANGYLANVTWITPSALDSDHGGINNGSGPDWVANVVNAIGASKFWPNTLIIVTWDDWGGLYDHVAPTQRNSYELGMRVPLIVISPYAKGGYVSHTQYEFGSILKQVEKTFSLPSLGTTDAGANDLSDFFAASNVPRTFVPIKVTRGPAYFKQQPNDVGVPDEE